MRLFAMACLLSLAAFWFGYAFGAGGQNQWNNPVFSDGCVAQLPPGIDLDTCQALPVEDSGLVTYFCQGEVITVTCPDDGPRAPQGQR